MIKVKLEKNKRDDFILKLRVENELMEKYKILKRIILESRYISGEYNYNVQLKFLPVILKNIPLVDIDLDDESILSYFEFSDDYDDKYYYSTEADAKYMRKWRQEGCPLIYKVIIDKDNGSISKEVVFKRISKITQ